MTSWSAYRDPAARRAAAAGARRPILPITDEREALEHAVWLDRLGLSARSISVVMAHYHGQWAEPATWNRRIRRVQPRP